MSPQELPEQGCNKELPIGTPAPDLSSGLTPEAFPKKAIAAGQRRFEISVFLHLDGLPTEVYEPHLPEAAGFKVPVTHLSPLLLSVETVPPREGQELDSVI